MSYVILGRTIKNEYLALGTLAATGFAVFSSLGGSKDAAPKKPTTLEQVKEVVKLNASSSEEEKFIKQFLADAEKETKH